MKKIMCGFLVLSVLVIGACAGKKQSEPPPDLEPPVQEEPQAVVEQHDRLAKITVHDVLLLGGVEGDENNYSLKTCALKRLDSPTALKLFGMAYEKYFTEEEAEKIADFLESPEGQSGVRILGDWLLSGKFMVEPEPPEIIILWGKFRETAEGVKFFVEIVKVYKEVSRLAIEAGVGVLKNAGPAILKSL